MSASGRESFIRGRCCGAASGRFGRGNLIFAQGPPPAKPAGPPSRQPEQTAWTNRGAAGPTSLERGVAFRRRGPGVGGGLFGKVLELDVFVEKRQFDLAGRAVALFADNQLRNAVQVFAVGFVDFLAKDEADQVGVLFNRSALTQVAQLRTMVAGADFRSTA